MKMIFLVRSVSLAVKRKLNRRVIIETFPKGAQTWCRWMIERHELVVMEMKCLRSTYVRSDLVGCSWLGGRMSK